MKFYNREEECNILLENEKQSSSSAVFTVMTGRRRIGKTSLILHALADKPFAYLFVSNDSEAVLCGKFQQVITEQLGINVYGSMTRFRDIFELLMKESQKRQFTVVIDEFQSLMRVNAAIFSEIQDLWDRYHATSHINLIACGSIQSLMKRIFERKGEPLYGRPTSKFYLRPFKVEVLKQILADNYPSYSNEDLLCLYMITGGVAKYVELLMDAHCFTRTQMLDYVCRPDSYFLTEGYDILNQEFSNESTVYFSILQLVANGLTRRSEIDGAIQKETGTYLLNLEQNFKLLKCVKPILAKPNSKTSAYEISDPFLRFWFRFICPYQSLIELRQLGLLRSNIDKHYEQFSGHTLEQYFRAGAMESGKYTQVGNWWDRKGENEIDMIALNEFDHTGVVAEIKRNRSKINLNALQRKILALPDPAFHKFNFTTLGLSMDDM